MDKQKEFKIAIENNDINKVKILLKNKKVDPSEYNNLAIRTAAYKGYFDIVNLLWNDKRVKNTLKKDNLPLYNQLIKEDIKNKVIKF